MNQVLELHLVEAWFKLNKPNQPCIMFRYWQDTDTEQNSIGYFKNIFKEAKINIIIPNDTLSQYILLDIDAALVHKLVQAVHDYDKWGEDLYGWDGKTFYWSRD